MTPKPITQDSCIVRGTHARKGRHVFVTPETTATHWLHYGRLNLDAQHPPVSFENVGCETALIGLRGLASVRAAGLQWTLGRYDALYVPKGQTIEVIAGPDGCDLAELAAPVDGTYAPAFVAYDNVKRRCGAAFPRRRARLVARAQHPDRQERRSRAAAGRGHVQRSWQLDLVAAARARDDAGRDLSLHRHAVARVRRAVRLHRSREPRARDVRPRRGLRDHSAGLSPQRGRAGRPHRVPLVHGGASRGRRSAVRRRQRAARVRRGAVRDWKRRASRVRTRACLQSST